MTMPEVALDDLRFQDLVNECRKSITKHCPEWTEVNVSDPGITLIELFAWMTDMLSYRINRLPEKLHVALLSLLDVRLRPPEAACTELRFVFEHPPAQEVQIPAWETEVATQRTQMHGPIVFQTNTDFTIHPVRPTVCLFKRGSDWLDIPVSDDRAQPQGRDCSAFSEKPLAGDCLMLGFDRPLDRLLMRVDVDCMAARGVGVNPKKPPLAWQVSVPHVARAQAQQDVQAGLARGDWSAAIEPLSDTTEGFIAPAGPADANWSDALVPLSDTTEGFNVERGSIELDLPPRTAAIPIEGHSHPRHWLRCSVVAPSADAPGNRYQSPPQIFSLTAAPVGAMIPAQHLRRVEKELLGRSDGTPGQTFRLRCPPILPARDAEHLEVRDPDDPDSDRWGHWRRVETFAESKRDDHHYMLDESTGEIELGPAVRQSDGAFRHYGAIPPQRSELRFSAYRHGGGTLGNVAEKTLTRLRRPIAGVRSVTNPRAASGGVDAESLELARARASAVLRTRTRAVTREDFEDLAHVASGRVARAHCVSGEDAGVPWVYIVPKVVESPVGRMLQPRELRADRDLLDEVKRRLDECRLVGTTVCLAIPRFRAVRVVVQAVASPSADAVDVQRRILEALNTYLNPLVGGSVGSAGEGWEFARPLRQGELYPIVHGLEGVHKILLMEVYEEELETGEVIRGALTEDLKLSPGELIVSGRHRVKVDPLSAA
jgi:predicted phage baseplate assembly protein